MMISSQAMAAASTHNGRSAGRPTGVMPPGVWPVISTDVSLGPNEAFRVPKRCLTALLTSSRVVASSTQARVDGRVGLADDDDGVGRDRRRVAVGRAERLGVGLVVVAGDDGERHVDAIERGGHVRMQQRQVSHGAPTVPSRAALCSLRVGAHEFEHVSEVGTFTAQTGVGGIETPSRHQAQLDAVAAHHGGRRLIRVETPLVAVRTLEVKGHRTVERSPGVAERVRHGPPSESGDVAQAGERRRA